MVYTFLQTAESFHICKVRKLMRLQNATAQTLNLDVTLCNKNAIRIDAYSSVTTKVSTFSNTLSATIST